MADGKKLAGTLFRRTKKLAGTMFRPSLNREASRLGDVRVRRPSSRAQDPETRRDKHRVLERWTFRPRPTSRNFFWLVCKNCNALKPAAIGIGGRTCASTDQLSRLSATLRSRKSRNTLIRLELRSSSG